MKRFSKSELQKINELVEEKASLRVISSVMNRGKSSVQYQVAKLKGKKPREREFRFDYLSDKELGWLIGCYAGDGSRNLRKNSYSYGVKFALNKKEQLIAEFVETLLRKCDVNTWRSVEEQRLYVKCKNKSLFYFFEKYLKWDGTRKSKSVRLSDLSSYSNNFLFGFLCGIIDADGGTKRLYISTSSKQMMEHLKEICEKLGIAINVLEYDVFHVYLRKLDYRRVCQEQDFSSIKHREL